MNNRESGSYHESMAIEYLTGKGYKIIDRNVLNKCGEIDIICISEKNEIVFVEVKFRSSSKAGDPLEAVDRRKIRKICKASAAYLSYHSEYSNMQVRYDVIGIYDDGKLNHIENAFYYEV
ncbi:MAG: YraN family protein [Lachnospiraceae bacterium]|nr:YraN family protein [Lachnospiraceae bacterium]